MASEATTIEETDSFPLADDGRCNRNLTVWGDLPSFLNELCQDGDAMVQWSAYGPVLLLSL